MGVVVSNSSNKMTPNFHADLRSIYRNNLSIKSILFYKKFTKITIYYTQASNNNTKSN